MDYNSMEKLAFVMGEEFKMIDSVTLENINLQRLITKEKEYCASLETLLKENDDEIEKAENETRRLKCQLEEVKNSGQLLKTSLESLRSSHKMVDLLKVDLLKQLHLEEIKSSEQNVKFDTTIKKYEVMWESYQSTYQKFPLVADLHKSELRLKQKSIQLAIHERSVKVLEENIKALKDIIDKREKVVVVNIAEKYLQRAKHFEEKNTLEKNIRLKEETLKIVKEDETRGHPLGTFNSDIHGEYRRKTGSSVMDVNLSESNRENIFFLPDVRTCTPSKISSQRYETILAKRIHSVPLLKFPPLPLLDSPPRKVRSVGNLLSPPKVDWSKDDNDGLTVKHTYNDIQKCTAPDISSHEQNSLKSVKEDQKILKSGAGNMNLNVSTNSSLTKMENETVSNDLQPEEEHKMRMPEMEIDSKGKEMETMEVDEKIRSVENSSEVEHLPKQPNELKTIPPLDSVEFSYEPRADTKCSKMSVTGTEEMKSPYFVSSYLNFLEIPKNMEESVEKPSKSLKNSPSSDLDKNKTVVMDLTDDNEEQEINTKENSGQVKQDVLSKDEKESEVRPKEIDSLQPSEMDVDRYNSPCNDTYIIHDGAGKSYEGNDDKGAIIHDSSLCQSTSNEDKSYQFDMGQGNQNLSYETAMEFSQISCTDSAEYAETSYVSMSPDPSRALSPFSASPNINNHDRVNIFGSPPGIPSFNYEYSELQPSSASALFGNSTPVKNKDQTKKQSEVFNFAFDSKRNTATMFKLF